MTDMYIFDEDGYPIPCDDPIAWGRWMEKNRQAKFIGEDFVRMPQIGVVRVSTVFLGLDHAFAFDKLEHVPKLYETMTFALTECKFDQLQWRYDTREEAQRGHAAAVSHLEQHGGVLVTEEPGVPEAFHEEHKRLFDERMKKWREEMESWAPESPDWRLEDEC